MEDEDFDDDEWEQVENEFEDDEDLNEYGETQEEEQARHKIMNQFFFSEENSMSDHEKLDSLVSHDCFECGGRIEEIIDSTEESLMGCDSCGKEYEYCLTCTAYFDAINEQCPNDH